MRTVGLEVLKDKLDEYVRLAASGETVLISESDRVVAELVPPRESRSPQVADAVLAKLVREGVLTPALSPGAVPLKPHPVARLDELLAGLDADRADR